MASVRKESEGMHLLARTKSISAYLWERIVRYAWKFGLVGGLGLVVNVVLFNLLRLGVFGTGHFFQGAIGASMVAVTVSILFNWVGNRYWTFREHRRKNYAKELLEYVIVSLGGMAFQLGSLYLSHEVLGYTSLLADNISGNLIGVGLGTIFRFLLYRFWVYGHHRSGGLVASRNEAEAAALAIYEDEAFASHHATELGTGAIQLSPRRSVPFG